MHTEHGRNSKKRSKNKNRGIDVFEFLIIVLKIKKYKYKQSEAKVLAWNWSYYGKKVYQLKESAAWRRSAIRSRVKQKAKLLMPSK